MSRFEEFKKIKMQTLSQIPTDPVALAKFRAANWGPTSEIIMGIFVSLATVFVMLRLTARRMSNWSYGWDDALIILAVIFTWSIFASMVFLVHHGLGRHTIFILSDVPDILKGLIWFRLSYYSALPCVRLSILVIYQRIFPSRTFRHLTYGFAAVVVAWYITTLFVVFLGCQPFKLSWLLLDPSVKGSCINENAFFPAVAIINIIIDLSIVALPVPWLMKMQIALRKKIVVVVMFALGSFASVISAVRIQYTFHVVEPDFLFHWPETLLYSSLEASVGTICACIPTLAPLTLMFRRKYQFRSTQDSSRHGEKSARSTMRTARNTHNDEDEYDLEESRYRYHVDDAPSVGTSTDSTPLKNDAYNPRPI